MKGSEFVQQVKDVRNPKLSELALSAILAGNTPSFMEQTVECFTEAVIDRKYFRCVYTVHPQYLSIGDDQDFVQWPLSMVDLQRYCDATKLHWYIPTKKLVWNNWLFTECKINPQTIAPSAQMSSPQAILDEQRLINAAMVKEGCPLTAFSRAKKAYIVSPKMDGSTLHFTGWYDKSGQAIQKGDSTGGHEASYADYSHGCDVVRYDFHVNGRQYDYAELCQHPVLHVLVSDQGPFNPIFPIGPQQVFNPVSARTDVPPEDELPANYHGPVYKTALATGKPVLVESGFFSAPDGASDGANGRILLGLSAGLLGYAMIRSWNFKH